jgi:predicted nucleotidyltransferase component of viral defense system
MSPSRERLLDLSAESGFRSDVLEKVLRLGELAGDVSKHPLLSTALALKGGTALNLCFGPPRRLSVDLDFNYVGGSDREQMLRDRPEVERAVQAIAEGRGYRIQRSRDEHAGRKLFLGYMNAAGTGDRIEVDLNFLFRVPLDPAWEAELWQPDGEAPRIRVVGPAELCAGKLCALLDRALPRDLFDVPQLPAALGSDWPTPRFRRLFHALAGTLDLPLSRYGAERFQRVTDHRIAAELHPMLRESERPTGADLRREARTLLAPLLASDAAEREFSERLQRGDLCPEILFPDDDETTERLRLHPALRWKAENAAVHSRTTR